MLGAALEQKQALTFLGLAHYAFERALAFVSALELQQCRDKETQFSQLLGTIRAA